jgi:hypothetical protein
METGDESAKRLEMAAVNEGSHTQMADDIDWGVSHIDCLCKWHVVNCFPVIVTCRHSVVGSEIGTQV